MNSGCVFLNKIAKLADEFDMFPKGGILMVGISGGADSMCLLDALLELSVMGGFTVAAAHFNHMLRGDESDLDEAFVVKECRNRDVELMVDSADVMAYASQKGIGKVEAARELRYAFFEKAADELSSVNHNKTVHIATAHNADDLAETVIMNITRGAGNVGLSGIPPKRGLVVRPMLHISRDEIMRYINANGIKFVEDSSNSLQNQLRNKIRHSVIPVLRDINPRFTEALVRSTQQSRRDEDYLQSLAKDYVDSSFLSVKEITALPYPIKSRIIRQMGSSALTYVHINAVLELCDSGNPSGSLSLPGLIVRREYDKVIFEKKADLAEKFDKKSENKQKLDHISLDVGTDTIIPKAGLRVLCSEVEYEESQIVKTFSTFLFHIDEICGTMSVGSRRKGDTIRLFGSNQTKSLKKLYIDNRVPAVKRGLIPVIFDEQGVLAVYGMCRSNRALPVDGAKALKVEFLLIANC